MSDGQGETDQPSVVVIDNDLAVLNALQFALELEGYRVLPFRTGAEVLAQQRLPDTGLLIVDFKLPDMTGLQLLNALRERQVTLPAILLTHLTSPVVRREAEESGTPIVEKPLLSDALWEAIQSALPLAPPEEAKAPTDG